MGNLCLPGDGPHKGGHLAGDSEHDLIDVLSSGYQPPGAFTEMYLRFPTNVLDGCRHLFQVQLQATTDFGWVAIGPRAFDEDATGVGVAGFGDRPWRRRSPVECSLRIAERVTWYPRRPCVCQTSPACGLLPHRLGRTSVHGNSSRMILLILQLRL